MDGSHKNTLFYGLLLYILTRMNIQEYFKTIQSYKLSDAQKNDLYERILQKTTKKTISPFRTHFFTKVIWYTVLLVLVGLSIYIPYLGQRTTHNAGVYADYIANIVKVQGSFFIESNGKQIDGSNIRDKDTVVLADGGSITFHVSDDIEGKITWPASFIINRQADWYAITLLEGDYIELAAIGEDATTPTVELISNKTKLTTKTNTGEKFHFVMAKKWDKPTITNKSGSELAVTNTETNTENTPTMVAKNTVLTVNPDGTRVLLAENQLFSNGKETEAPAVITKNDNYEDSFFNTLLASRSAQTPEAEETTAPVEAMVTMDAVDMGASKQSIIDRKLLRDNLIPQFVWVDLKYVTYYYLNGQQLEYQRSFNNMYQRIEKIYVALSLPMPTADSLGNDKQDPFALKNLVNLMVYLNNNLSEDIPKNDTNTVRTLAAYFSKLNEYTFGQFAWEGLFLEDMFERINQDQVK